MTIPNFPRTSSPFRKSSHSTRNSEKGFSLTELLVVVALIGVLAALVVPSMGSIGGAQSLTNSAATIATTFEQARAYAMANNTYVYVGIFAANGDKSDTVRPQPAGDGRLYVTAAAVNDGSNGYPDGNWLPGTGAMATKLVPLGRTQRFENIALVDFDTVKSKLTLPNDPPAASLVEFKQKTVPTVLNPANLSQPSNTAPVAKYDKVIQFSPTGGVNMVEDIKKNPRLPAYVQFALFPARGSAFDAGSPNFAAIRIDGVTGNVKTYRP